MEKTGISYTLLGILSGFTGLKAYAAILGMLFLCGMGVPMPEDITLIIAGMLAGIGSINVWGAFFAGYFGVLIGDAILFFIGRKFGRKVFEFRLFKKMFTAERIAYAEEKIHNNDKFICFVARFMPGLRAVIYLTCGVLRVRPSVFLFQDGLAALLSVPIWIALGYWFGNNIDKAFETAKDIQIYLIIGLVVFVGGYILYKKRKTRQLPTK